MSVTPSKRPANGFTLVELLVVLGIMAILASIAMTALPSLMSAQGVSKAAADLSQVFDDARAYAIANRTYVFVGFEEVDASKIANAAGQTQLASTTGGRLAVVVVASMDGTNNYSGTTWQAPTTTTSNLTPISQFRFYNGIHMADFSGFSGTGGTNMTGRVTVTSGNSLGSSANATGGSTVLFTWPIGAATASIQYKFYVNQVIQFDQEGLASMVTSTTYAAPNPGWMEVGLQLTHGNVVPSAAPATIATGQVAAIQIDGVTGANHVLRP